ncbi:MAG: hypothetical protein H7A01_18390 [Hahellaceae bacterium]|nr:hypothetical protein [Hahellaceae bacterium]MCP5213058.1 hypothetical protein [Hahellaceae bacterium]
MKFYKAIVALTIKKKDSQSLVWFNKECHLKFESGQLFVLYFGVSPIYEQSFTYLGHEFEVSSVKQFKSAVPPIGKEGIQILDADNAVQKLDLKPEQLNCILNNLNTNSKTKFASIIGGVAKKRSYSLAVFDTENSQFLTKEVGLFLCDFIEDHFYGFDLSKREFLKIDSQLKTLWVMSDGKTGLLAQRPKKYLNTVIVFIGPENEERNIVDGRAKYTCSGGKLYGLNDADGSVVWQIDMPNSMDGYELVGDILYAVSLNEIFLINPETGEIKQTLDTKTSTPFNRDLKPTITIDDKFIYYTQYDDAVILAYDVNTLEQVRRIDMPEGYYPKEHNFRDTTTGKQYFTIHNKTQYVAQWPVLEIDPNDLDSPVEFEKEPEMVAEFQPSAENKEELEFVIRMKTNSLDDALRFGEIYTRDYAQWHSYNYMGMSFADRKPAENFNGIIRFVYSGCDKSADVVNEHLHIMEKRFDKWIEKEGFFSCTNKKQPTQLIAEYVE